MWPLGEKVPMPYGNRKIKPAILKEGDASSRPSPTRPVLSRPLDLVAPCPGENNTRPGLPRTVAVPLVEIVAPRGPPTLPYDSLVFLGATRPPFLVAVAPRITTIVPRPRRPFCPALDPVGAT